jgi:DNA modification methylase
MHKEVIGNSTLYLGDCLTVLPELRAAAVITDPPYGIADSVMKAGVRSGKRTGGDNTWSATSWWDKELNHAWGPAVCACAPVVAWFGQWRKRGQVEEMMTHPLRTEIVWAKDCHAGPPCPVAPRDERIWVFAAEGIKGATFETSVWDQAVIPTWSQKEHKNEKPVGLMRRLVAWIGAETVIDPFMGSGTTGVACMELNRKFIGVEIDPQHFATACQRIDNAQRQERMFA